VRVVASAVEESESTVHNVGCRLEGVASIDPGGWVDVASVGAIFNPVEVIRSILLVHVADGVEELVVDSAGADAPVRKSQRLPAVLDVRLAVGAAGAYANVGPAAGTAGSLASDVDTDVVAEVGIIDELETAHGQGEVVKLVVDRLPVLSRNGILDCVRDDVFTIGKFAARKKKLGNSKPVYKKQALRQVLNLR
jgi:hypothetical protein